MPRSLLLGVAAMAVIVIASNILVQFLVGDWLTWGAFTYPFAFLVTDLMNRLHGPGAARRVVAAGFVVGLACSFVGSQIEGPFGPLVSLRVAIGSGDGLPGRAAPRRGGLQPAARRELVAGAVRVERRWAASLDTVHLLHHRLLGVAWPSSRRAVDVGWANEAVPLLGRGPVAPLWVSLAVADFLVKLAHRRVRAGAVSRRARLLRPARLNLRLRFAAGLARSGQPKPAKGGDPMSSETLEREAGFTRRGTA